MLSNLSSLDFIDNTDCQRGLHNNNYQVMTYSFQLLDLGTPELRGLLRRNTQLGSYFVSVPQVFQTFYRDKTPPLSALFFCQRLWKEPGASSGLYAHFLPSFGLLPNWWVIKYVAYNVNVVFNMF